MKSFEMMFIPTNSGLMKIYIYALDRKNSRMKVYAELHDQLESATGYNKKKTVASAIEKLLKKFAEKETGPSGPAAGK
jgi:hypothetical protein